MFKKILFIVIIIALILFLIVYFLQHNEIVSSQLFNLMETRFSDDTLKKIADLLKIDY
jgi:hypothetical protein